VSEEEKRGRGRPRNAPDRATDSSQRKRDQDIERGRERTAKGAEIGEIPSIVNPARRAACAADPVLFATTYFPNSAGKYPMCKDHLDMYSITQTAIDEGGQFVNVFPRGAGKSTNVEVLCLWGATNAKARFPVLIAAEAGLATDSLDSMKRELVENDLLAEDYPEICYPFRALDGKSQRCRSQTHNGNLTHIGWRKDTIVFPTIEGSPASGAIIKTKGLTASLLGLRHKASDGTQVRPDLIICDDIETRESAAQPAQVKKRLNILVKSILGLGGHDKTLACVVNGTILAAGCATEQLLDAKLFPAWQGKRVKMLLAPADAQEDFWLGKYREVRHSFDPEDAADRKRALREADELYLANRDLADAGAKVFWEHCYNRTTEHSAIQHAYNLLIDRGPDYFATECQNEPLRDESKTSAVAVADVRSHVIAIDPWKMPTGTSTLTAFIDIQKDLLYWLVAAWGPGLRGHVVGYGAYPDQPRSYFKLREAGPTLTDAVAGASLETAIAKGLEVVCRNLLGREVSHDWDDATSKISLLLIDSNWQQSANVVREFVRRSPWGTRVMPSSGRYVGVAGRTLTDKAPAPGERQGANWRTSTIERVKHLQWDTNVWKTMTAGRLKLPATDANTITVHGGTPAQQRHHELLADHLASEYPTRALSKERACDLWSLTPGQDNHWWDGLVGSAVGASFVGIEAVGATIMDRHRARKVVSTEEIAARAAELAAMMR
jgi:hypothetical protein